MSDLISRSALLEKIAHHTMFDCLKCVTFESANTYEQTKGAMFDLAQKAPAVDAMPVVRCRGCAYACKAMMTGTLYCELHESYAFAVRPDGYCSRGAKMRGDADAE